MDQIENEKMTLSVIVTCGIVTATSYCCYHVVRRQLDTWQKFIIFYIKKNHEFTRDTSLTLLVRTNKNDLIASNLPK